MANRKRAKRIKRQNGHVRGKLKFNTHGVAKEALERKQRRAEED